MSGFLYFLSDHVGEIGDQNLVRHGIHYAIERSEMAGPRGVVLGPNGRAGVLVAHKSFPLNRLTFKADEQEWIQHAKVENTWVGKWQSDSISPSDLQRLQMVDGASVTLEDGSKWKAAHARRFEHLDGGHLRCFSPLPKTLTATKDGWAPTRIAKRYRRLADLADLFWREKLEAAKQTESETFTWFSKYADELAVAALTANYRIAETELTLLELYGTNSRAELLSVAMDDKTLHDWQKKTVESGHDGTIFFDGPMLSTTE